MFGRDLVEGGGEGGGEIGRLLPTGAAVVVGGGWAAGEGEAA